MGKIGSTQEVKQIKFKIHILKMNASLLKHVFIINIVIGLLAIYRPIPNIDYLKYTWKDFSHLSDWLVSVCILFFKSTV